MWFQMEMLSFRRFISKYLVAVLLMWYVRMGLWNYKSIYASKSFSTGYMAHDTYLGVFLAYS